MDKFEKFNREFFRDRIPKDAIHSNKRFTFKIGPLNRATIRLSDAGYHDQHHGYFIEISSASSGKIDSAAFFFEAELTARIDSRNDYKGGFHVWHDADWYIAKPARNEIDAMADKIFAFISMYEGV